jgi:hypothetical protein
MTTIAANLMSNMMAVGALPAERGEGGSDNGTRDVKCKGVTEDLRAHVSFLSTRVYVSEDPQSTTSAVSVCVGLMEKQACHANLLLCVEKDMINNATLYIRRAVNARALVKPSNLPLQRHTLVEHTLLCTHVRQNRVAGWP